jgi:hypothetical protein
MAVKPIETAPKPLKECDSPRSEVMTVALIEVEEVLCVFVNCGLISKKNSTVIINECTVTINRGVYWFLLIQVS